MKFLIALVLGVAIGAAAVCYFNSNHDRTQVQSTQDQIESAARSARDTIADKLREWHLTGGDVTDELARTGRIIREKAESAGKAIADATADTRTTATIKAKLLKDSALSSRDISVNTSGRVVTLSGTASSPDDIGKAIVLAMETDGVRQVVSTIQVKRN